MVTVEPNDEYKKVVKGKQQYLASQQEVFVSDTESGFLTVCPQSSGLKSKERGTGGDSAIGGVQRVEDMRDWREADRVLTIQTRRRSKDTRVFKAHAPLVSVS